MQLFVALLFVSEVAIPPAAVSIKLIYPAADLMHPAAWSVSSAFRRCKKALFKVTTDAVVS